MKRVSLIILCLMALIACATRGPTDAQRLALYQSHAGEPLRQVRYYNPISWDRIDGQHIVITMRPREQYLLKLSGPCLDWGSGAPVIGLTTQAGFVMSRFDRVTVNGAPMSCMIDEIRALDVPAVRAGEKALRAQPSGT